MFSDELLFLVTLFKGTVQASPIIFWEYIRKNIIWVGIDAK